MGTVVDASKNALIDPQRIRTPSITDYWKPFAEDVYCWKGLRFSARQDLEGFSRFTEQGIEGVVPPELLPPDVRAKYHAKSSEKTKRAKKEDKAKGNASQPDGSQDHQGYSPGSMVDFARDHDGSPILAVSSLAVHSKCLGLALSHISI